MHINPILIAFAHTEMKYVRTLHYYAIERLCRFFILDLCNGTQKDTGNKEGKPLNSSSEADASQRYGSLSWELMIHDRLCIRGVRLLEREPNREKKKGADTEEKEKPGLYDPSRCR